jgi:hypothetical protein
VFAAPNATQNLAGGLLIGTNGPQAQATTRGNGNLATGGGVIGHMTPPGRGAAGGDGLLICYGDGGSRIGNPRGGQRISSGIGAADGDGLGVC